VPVLIGIVIAASHGWFDAPTALLTIVGAAFVHLGINVSNDVFDTTQGADDVNVTPTQYSGGSRVIQYGLVSLPRMAAISAGFFALAAIVGLVLMVLRGSPALLAIGIVGFVLGIGYTAPPLKLVYRGLGEIAVAIGFGPLMLVGAYVVQSRGVVPWEPVVASLPVAVLVALILYVNEIPDRRGDAHAGKRTLPVRLPKPTVIRIYEIATAVAFASVVVGVVLGVLPVTTMLILLAVPLALRVRSGLAPNYDNPYGLMAVMGVNIRLHLVVGALLLVAYVIVIVAGAVLPEVPLFVR
jgi:1,4-dihydroxy-2-naphthoate octaprenyltransferase